MPATSNAASLAIIALMFASPSNSSYAADQPALAETSKPRSTGYRPDIVVYKNFHCDCCERWVEYLKAHRFNVRVINVDDLLKEKDRVGVPRGKDACHTAEIEGYFIEGHVPADDIKRLIRIKPDARGLTVPGMPIGSPGMERGKEFQPYDVLLVDKEGNTSVFAHHKK
jgi:hypothetical protein